MSTDDIRFSVPAVWLVLFRALSGSPWEEEDIDDAVYKKNQEARAAANALRHVYRQAETWSRADAEDGVLATLKAAQQFHGGTFLTPRQVKDMAAKFEIYYPSSLEPLEEYLDENCGPVGWHWLNEHGKKQVEQSVMDGSKIWVVGDVNVSDDVWVFNKPGQT
jgi:hypothetical protein